MSNPLFARLQATAQRLISKFGQHGTIKRLGSVDPVEGGDPVPVEYQATLVPMTYDQRYVNGTTILTSDRQIYISSVGLAIVPTVGDVVVAGGVDYHIVAADPNNYDGITNVVFICQGRLA